MHLSRWFWFKEGTYRFYHYAAATSRYFSLLVPPQQCRRRENASSREPPMCLPLSTLWTCGSSISTASEYASLLGSTINQVRGRDAQVTGSRTNSVTLDAINHDDCYTCACSGEFYLGFPRGDLQGVSWYRLLHWDSTREAQTKHRLSKYTG